jgi:hypothetical protein
MPAAQMRTSNNANDLLLILSPAICSDHYTALFAVAEYVKRYWEVERLNRIG